MPETEIINASALQLSDAIGRKLVSSLEVIEAHIRRIHEVNPKLNAVFHLAEDSARKLAVAADEELAQGCRRSPLHGVPFTIKDWIEVAGMPCVAGDEKYRNHVPKEDATVVARLIGAGCIPLGKTTVTDDSLVYGRTNNPYRFDYSPGGSSSGEAAIIAAGGSPLGLGSDSGGSIREPAHFCGITGLRPTTGRIPVTGHLPRINTFVDPRTVIGPMARFVQDLVVALPILAGVDWQDPSVVPMPNRDWQLVNTNELRGVFYSHYPGSAPTTDCGAITQRTARSLEESGIAMSEAIPNRLGEALAITQEYWSRAGSEGLDDEWLPDGDGRMSGIDVERHLFQWDRFRRSLIDFMKDYDFILTPVSDYPARLRGSFGGESYCLPYSLAGYPCVVVRAGSSEQGLPVGVQIVARPWREDVALAVAGLIEMQTGGWKAPCL
jgi:amidase